jgi:phage replication-related protein YjqB (UPF0714/DUF867 family)
VLETRFVTDDDESDIRLMERLRGERTSRGLAVLAPHGGWIERRTDEQAELVDGLLAARGAAVRAWIARGYNDVTGAHTCGHITSSEISERSLPKLGVLFADGRERGLFAHAVAFHSHDDSDAIVIVGGLPADDAQTALKRRLKRRIERALHEIGSPAPVEVRSSGPLSGVQRRNIVNRITTAGNGIQLEQPPAVRDDERQLAAVARSIAASYAELVDA